MSLYPRFLKPKVAEALKDTPVVCLLGPRQVGKSTLCQQIDAKRDYITLDDHAVLTTALQDPAGFVQSLSERVTLDEVQRAPDLLLAIKAEVDRNRKPGRFLITGSANLLLLPKVKESLAGRIEICYLHPLTEAEKTQTRSNFLPRLLGGQIQAQIKGGQFEVADLAGRVCAGGYPEPNTRSPQRARQWFRQYITTIIQNDVKDIANIRDEDELQRLMELLALRTGGLLNINNLANDMKMRRETTEKYVSILEHLFLIYRLPAWHNNQANRLIKTPKIHLVDSGLAAALNNVAAEDWFAASNQFGPILESFVIQQIRAQADWLDDPVRLSHYRDKDSVEVDLVIEHDRYVYGVEIKKSASVQARDGDGLARLANQVGAKFKGGILFYCGNNALPLSTPGCFAIPIDWLWRDQQDV